MDERRRLATFSDNRHRPIHRWYPFIEGYSADLLHLGLNFTSNNSPNIHDPFGGSGTTCLAASQLGLSSSYCEINPFLAWVADIKTNGYIRARHQADALDDLVRRIRSRSRPTTHSQIAHSLIETNTKRDYFEPDVAERILLALQLIDETLCGTIRDLARLALAMTLVPTSNMVRRTDLRRRADGDPLPKPFVPTLIRNLEIVAEDLRTNDFIPSAPTRFLCADARALRDSVYVDPFDLIVTSPPYLNGTNYCRNTKLELMTLGFITSENELSTLRSECITAGINNVSRRRPPPTLLPDVEPIARRLDVLAYDKRIAAMIRLYFSDMKEALASLRYRSSDTAVLMLDIGDSQFAGVHVPTHELLSTIAEDCGWRHIDTIHLRKRRSYSGTELVQVILYLEAS